MAKPNKYVVQVVITTTEPFKKKDIVALVADAIADDINVSKVTVRSVEKAND